MMADDPKAGEAGFVGAVRAAAFGPDPNAPDYVAPKLRATEREPLSVIQDRLRAEGAAGLRGGQIRARRRV